MQKKTRARTRRPPVRRLGTWRNTARGGVLSAIVIERESWRREYPHPRGGDAHVGTRAAGWVSSMAGVIAISRAGAAFAPAGAWARDEGKARRSCGPTTCVVGFTLS